MNNYRNIATIVIRAFACYLLLFVAIEWGIIAAGILLSIFRIFSRNPVAYEARLLSSVFYLIAGLVLYARSKSIASRITESLPDDSDSNEPGNTNNEDYSHDG